jgi:hypothetical protein
LNYTGAVRPPGLALSAPSDLVASIHHGDDGERRKSTDRTAEDWLRRSICCTLKAKDAVSKGRTESSPALTAGNDKNESMALEDSRASDGSSVVVDEKKKPATLDGKGTEIMVKYLRLAPALGLHILHVLSKLNSDPFSLKDFKLKNLIGSAQLMIKFCEEEVIRRYGFCSSDVDLSSDDSSDDASDGNGGSSDNDDSSGESVGRDEPDDAVKNAAATLNAMQRHA